MSRRRWLGLAVLLAVTLVATLIAARSPGGSGPSALSPGPGGWTGVRTYLEARGAEVELLDRVLTAEEAESLGDAVLVTGFPWSSGSLDYDFAPYRALLDQGGTLVVVYSGRLPGLAERRMLDDLDMEPRRARTTAPLGYLAWRSWQTEMWRLPPEPALGEQAEDLVLRPPTAVPEAPDDALVLYRAPEGRTAGAEEDRREDSERRRLVDDVMADLNLYLPEPLEDRAPVVFALRQGRGRALLLPAGLLANARIGEEENVALLETLVGWAGDRWLFDEHRHGLRPPGEAPSPIPRRILDLFFLHLIALYLLACWHLARRFGPAWKEPPVVSGSAAGLLQGLGSLHEKMGHHRAAGELLVERVRQLEISSGRPQLDEALSALGSADSGRELVQLARDVARARAEHGGLTHLYD